MWISGNTWGGRWRWVCGTDLGGLLMGMWSVATELYQVHFTYLLEIIISLSHTENDTDCMANINSDRWYLIKAAEVIAGNQVRGDNYKWMTKSLSTVYNFFCYIATKFFVYYLPIFWSFRCAWNLFYIIGHCCVCHFMIVSAMWPCARVLYDSPDHRCIPVILPTRWDRCTLIAWCSASWNGLWSEKCNIFRFGTCSNSWVKEWLKSGHYGKVVMLKNALLLADVLRDI